MSNIQKNQPIIEDNFALMLQHYSVLIAEQSQIHVDCYCIFSSDDPLKLKRCALAKNHYIVNVVSFCVAVIYKIQFTVPVCGFCNSILILQIIS